MEANEMQPGTGNEGRQALEEFQRGHHQMGGAIAVRGFELEDDLAVRSPAQAFVAESGTSDVATEPFEFLPLLGAAIGISMQAKPLGTDTALGLRCLWARQAHCGIFPRQYFLACPGAKGNAVGAGGGLQRGQGGIGIGIGQIWDFGVFCHERAVAREGLQQPRDDARKDSLKLVRGGSWDSLEDRDSIGEAIDAIEHQAMGIVEKP